METLKTRYHRLMGNKFFLEPADVKALTGYLKDQGWLSEKDHLKAIDKPGRGNMNLVLRVTPAKASSFIIKQARPWVEKFPQLEAPTERIMVEYTFYQQILSHPELSRFSPKLIGFDQDNHLIAMEDLGEARDYTFVYGKDSFFNREELSRAISYLNHLKRVPLPARYPANLSLRKLNHQHIFDLPFSADNQFNLDEIQTGLQRLSKLCKEDKALKDKIHYLGQYYLQFGKILLHGDFYPGSLLKTKEGLKVIDPEFSFGGPEEWDMAVFTAHLFLSNTSKDLINAAYSDFQESPEFDSCTFSGFVGVEILRRLVGLAQLPLEMGLNEKAGLIDRAISWIKNGKIDTLSEL